MRKPLVLAVAAVAAAVLALPARAHDVQWSIGISAPIGYSGAIGTVVGNAPVYAAPVYAAPVYVAPAPAYVAPPVVYAPPPRVIYAPAPVYAPAVYGAPVWVGPHRGRHWHHAPRVYYGPMS